MDYKIIADSCCDMTPELRGDLELTSIPLTMRLGQDEFIDDDKLDLPDFMKKMKNCNEKVGSASPAPNFYQEAIEKARNSFIITLSSQLSGSYANAVIGKKFADESGNCDSYVFDSKSASAGEVLIAVKLKELLSYKLPKDQIVEKIEHFISNMKTYFVLDRYDNLLKNGRLNRITGGLISVLGIKLVMGADATGNIALFAKVRGAKQMLQKLLSLIETSNKNTEGEDLIISHCNNEDLANRLKSEVERLYNFKKVLIVPTGGLSSLYTDDKGIVMAF